MSGVGAVVPVFVKNEETKGRGEKEAREEACRGEGLGMK